MNKIRSPYFLSIFTILIWSFGSYFGRLVSLHSPYVLILLSFVFTAIVLGFYFVYQSVKARTNLLAHFQWKYCFWGQFGYFAYLVPQVLSIRAFNNASEATILNYTWPIFTAIFSKLIFDKKNNSKGLIQILEVIAFVFGFLAVSLVSTKGNFSFSEIINPAGLIWGLISGCSYGLFSAYSSTVSDEDNPIFLLTAIAVSIALTLPFSLVDLKEVQSVTLRDLGAAAILGGGINGLGYILWTRSLRLASEQGISVSRVVSIAFVLPLLSLLVVTILLRESFLLENYFIASLCLIFLSSVMVQRSAQIAAWIRVKTFPDPLSK